MISTALSHFKTCFISNLNLDSNVHDLFINVELQYAKILEDSIIKLKRKNVLKSKGMKYYNYIIIDGLSLNKLLERFITDDGLKPREITLEDMVEFKAAIIYIGKGCNDRKLKHLQEALLVFNGEMKLSQVSAKLTKISKSWENASGVAVIQLFSDADHYVSLCRENAMIKSCKNLTNLINGSIYGLMKDKWSVFEIKNFGEMLLYFALKQCIVERPSIIFPKDIKKKKPVDFYEPKKYCIRSNYELNGILDCFLDMM